MGWQATNRDTIQTGNEDTIHGTNDVREETERCERGDGETRIRKTERERVKTVLVTIGMEFSGTMIEHFALVTTYKMA
jgi:hypothetical protein